MWPFNKGTNNYGYQTVPNPGPSEMGADGERHYKFKDDGAGGSSTIIGKIRKRQAKSVFYVIFFILVSYIILSIVIPTNTNDDNWFRFSINGNTNNNKNSNNSDKPAPSGPEPQGIIEEEKPPDETLACQPPRLNPYDESIKKFVEAPKYVNCQNKTSLWFNSTFDFKLITVGEPETEGAKSCCFKKLTRGKKNDDNDYKLSKECVPVSLNQSSITTIPPSTDFIAISCELTVVETSNASSNSGTTEPPGEKIISKYVDLHSFIPMKPDVETRISNYYKGLNSTSDVTEDGDVNTDLEKNRVNVVILGIDAVSHMNFIRIMPQSYSYLMKKLKAIEMHGVNKVGDNTYPNLAAALTSLNRSTMEETCRKDKAFDDCPFIFKDYAARGYRTSYGEDSTWMGIFNYLTKGFKSPPTDYYLRPFGVAAEKLIGTFKQMNAKLCYGPRLSFEVLLNYMKKLAYTMGMDKRYFQFIWATSLTHDYLNHGRMGDSHLLSTLKWFKEGGYLNKTVFILMSDHGIRWGSIHETLQGQLEERLPFLYFIMPDWFQQRYKEAYANLKGNRYRLTTPFDLYETLADLLNLTRLNPDIILERQRELVDLSQSGDGDRNLPRGISQFLPIPHSRTCESADIVEHYCTCHKLKEIPINHTEVQQAANYIVHKINNLVAVKPKCGFLALDSIKTAHMIESGFNFQNYKDKKGYQLVIETTPGHAVFAASVIRDKNGVWKVSGTISRTNLYGNQSHCVDDKDLKLYCYCLDMESTDVRK